MPSLVFDGKERALSLHQEVRAARLLEQPELSSGQAQLHRIIEGDNLPVMVALCREETASYDRVYLDPPYNTGNSVRGSWVYDDTGSATGISPALGGRQTSLPGSKRDRWLYMLTPRLCLSRTLLSEKGILFVSCAERELEFLALLVGEVFGTVNRVAIMSIRSLHTVRNSSKGFSSNTEHVICYAKNLADLVSSTDKATYLRVPSEKSPNYPHDEHDGKGPYRLDQLYARNYAVPYSYRFADGKEWNAPEGSFPRYTQHELRRMEEAGEVVWSGGVPRAKRYLNRVAAGEPPSTFPSQRLSGYNKDGTAELSALFDGRRVFSQPKPLALLRYLLQIQRPCDKAGRTQTVLDCYGGSGTTMEAVMALNAEDGGARRCTVIQTGYEQGGSGGPNICRDITRERILRASRVHGYEQGFHYCIAE